MKQLRFPDSFSFKMAWRDGRGKIGLLSLYSSSLIAGVAALVAILSFRSDILDTVEVQARELLGADLEIHNNQPWPEAVSTLIDTLGGNQATALEFTSMVIYGPERHTRLSQIRAVSGGYPFYGELKSDPASAAYTYQQDSSALVERSLMNQLGLSVGDSIHIGGQTLLIAGALLEVPGESAAFSLAGPRVYLPRESVEGTTLLQRGSRIRYKSWFQFEPERDLGPILTTLDELRRDYPIRYATVESERRRFEGVVENLFRFLALVSFIAVLLGGIGVASSVWLYTKRISRTVATLRCLGASSRQTTDSFALQVLAMTLFGSLIGTFVGILIQRMLPWLIADFLPFEIVQHTSTEAVLIGLFTGVGVGVAFALLPVLGMVKIPPMLTLRTTDISPVQRLSRTTRISATFFTVLLFILFTGWISGDWYASLLFTAALLVALLFLLGLSRLLIRILLTLRLRRLPYVWRQGISNLFRPNNQTTIVLVTLGMGILLIGTLNLSRDMLLNRIHLQTGEEQPNLVFYDIQTDQQEGLQHLIESEGGDLMEHVPIVTMRLSRLHGRTVRDLRADSTAGMRRWVLNREYRVTYRDHLTDAETLIDGEWTPSVDGIDQFIPISLEESIAEELQVQIGDTLEFDLQGVLLQTTIGSIRNVDFQRPRPNFFVLFPAGALEAAPQFFASVVRTGGEDQTADLQQLVAATYPNISAIDIGLVLDSIERFLGQVGMAIRFMTLFTLVAGLIVLAVSIAVSRNQRIREAVLLRTLGASRREITTIQLIEYILLGLLASLAGLILALGASWGIARFWFELQMRPDLLSLSSILAGVLIFTVLTGFLSMRNTLHQKPFELLRAEAE